MSDDLLTWVWEGADGQPLAGDVRIVMLDEAFTQASEQVESKSVDDDARNFGGE